MIAIAIAAIGCGAMGAALAIAALRYLDETSAHTARQNEGNNR